MAKTVDNKAFDLMTAVADKTNVDIKKEGLYSDYVKKARGLRGGNVRPNFDESGKRIGESTVKMATELMEGRWVSFPTLYREKSGEWTDYMENVSPEKEWEARKSAYERAKKDNEVFDFGKNKKEAIAFGLGSWKPK